MLCLEGLFSYSDMLFVGLDEVCVSLFFLCFVLFMFIGTKGRKSYVLQHWEITLAEMSIFSMCENSTSGYESSTLYAVYEFEESLADR